MPTPTETPLQHEAIRWGRVRLAHEAAMVDDARRVLAGHRRQNAAHAAEHTGTPEAEEMGDIIAGDVTVHHHHEAPAPTPAPAAGRGLARLAAAALATAIGGPLGIAAYQLPDILAALDPPANPAPPSQPAQPAPVDVNTLFDLYVGPPAEPAAD